MSNMNVYVKSDYNCQIYVADLLKVENTPPETCKHMHKVLKKMSNVRRNKIFMQIPTIYLIASVHSIHSPAVYNPVIGRACCNRV